MILTLETGNSKPEASYGACFKTNHHESCGRTAERFAKAPHRFIIQSRLVEGFVAGFYQPVQAPELLQQAIAFDRADAGDLIQL